MDWRDNILAIAATQEQFGLTKDGKVGADTFRFIVEEQTLEGMDTANENCLTMFRVVVHPVQTAATAGPGGTTPDSRPSCRRCPVLQPVQLL